MRPFLRLLLLLLLLLRPLVYSRALGHAHHVPWNEGRRNRFNPTAVGAPVRSLMEPFVQSSLQRLEKK
uniref:Putative secreted protein n=1 Tax=Anopheles marajoara TaxID=58244 RepID=A0A2M4CF66_9DIPT